MYEGQISPRNAEFSMMENSQYMEVLENGEDLIF